MQLWQIKIPAHETWHFTVFCAGIVLGMAVSATQFAEFFAAWQWMLIGAILFGFVWWKRWRWLLALALVAGLFVGMSRGALDVDARNFYKVKYGQVVTLTGRVSEDVDSGKKDEMMIRLADVHSGEQALPGQLWITVFDQADIQRSDIVTVRGKLQPGFGSFAASMYRAEIVKIERPQPGDVALHVREGFGDKVRLGIGEPAASLGMGYLTGQRRSLPDDLNASLKMAGLTHIVVASGYNLTILIRAMKRLFEKRSRYLTIFLSGLLIVSFIAVTGLSPSMTRAGLVAGLALGAWYFGQKFHPVTLLVFAAAVTGLADPSYVWGNLGWQLSFAAFGGVMVLAPLLQNYFFGDTKPGWVRQVLGETISAQIATAPLILYSFGSISNVAVIANLLVLPLVPLAMVLTYIAGIAGYLLPAIVSIVALPAQWLLDYMVTVAMTTANLSWAQTQFELPLWGLITSFVVLIVTVWWMQRAIGYKLRDGSIVE